MRKLIVATLSAFLVAAPAFAGMLGETVKGTTDYSVELKIIDSTDGTPETAVVFNTAGIDLWYRREGAVSTDITEATLAALTTAHADGGFLAINDGVYRLDLPDAAVAAGADYVYVGGTVTGMIVIGGRVKLTDVNMNDGVRGGMTALPNAAADAAGGLPISDAGALDLDALNVNINDIETDTGTTGVLLAATATSAQLVDDTWDEVLTGGTHNVVNSSGRKLRTLGESGGYEGGYVWIDTVGGTAGTVDFENGTVNNPVDSIADALTLVSSVGLAGVHVLPGSSITLAAAFSDLEMTGHNYTLALGGQSISGSYIAGATVSGTFTGTTAIFDNNIINALTGPGLTIRNSYLNEVTLTNNGTAGWFINDSRSRVAGTGSPNFDFGVGVLNTGLSMRNWSGGIELENMGDAGTDNASIEGFGNIILNANVDGGTLVKRGVFDFTDSSGGSPTIVEDEITEESGLILADTVVIGTPSDLGGGATLSANNSDMAGATFTAGDDSQEAIRNRGDAAWITGGAGSGTPTLADETAQGGSASTIQLAASETFADDALNGNSVCINAGTGLGQCRNISDYVSSTDTATVEPDWAINPDATSNYYVQFGSVNVSVWDGADITTALETSADIADAVLDEDLTAHQTTGSLGAALGDGDAGSGLASVPWNSAWDTEVQSEANDALIVNHMDHLLAADYDPATPPGVATALLNELIESDAGVSRYTVNALEQGPSGSGASAASIADAVWDEATVGHTTAGTFGEQASTDIDAILVDTGTTLDAALATVDGNVDAILVDTGTTLDAALAVVDANVDAVLADTGTDGVALGANSITAAVIAADAIGSSELAATAANEIWGVACEDQGGGYTCQEAMSLLLAEALGTCTYTSGTRTWVCADPSGTETRFTLVYGVELDGDRTSSTPAPITP